MKLLFMRRTLSSKNVYFTDINTTSTELFKGSASNEFIMYHFVLGVSTFVTKSDSLA